MVYRVAMVFTGGCVQTPGMSRTLRSDMDVHRHGTCCMLHARIVYDRLVALFLAKSPDLYSLGVMKEIAHIFVQPRAIAWRKLGFVYTL